MRTPQRLHALRLLLDSIRALAPLVRRIRARDRPLADQLSRALTSAALNLGESQGSDPGNRRARLASALGSLQEARTALLVANAWGYVGSDEVQPIDAALDSIAAMTFTLARR